jgi:hypothetical protein
MPDPETQIEELRAALDLAGFPREADHWRLADLLQCRGVLRLRWTDAPRSYAHALPEGVWLVTLSQRRPESETVTRLLEEIAHALTACHRAHEGNNRLHLLNDDRDEHLARRWVLTWLLPWSLIGDPATRARQLRRSSATPGQVEERLRVLGRGVVDLEAV